MVLQAFGIRLDLVNLLNVKKTYTNGSEVSYSIEFQYTREYILRLLTRSTIYIFSNILWSYLCLVKYIKETSNIFNFILLMTINFA